MSGLFELFKSARHPRVDLLSPPCGYRVVLQGMEEKHNFIGHWKNKSNTIKENNNKTLCRVTTFCLMAIKVFTIQKRVPVAKSAYCSIVDRTLKIRHTRTKRKL